MHLSDFERLEHAAVALERVRAQQRVPRHSAHALLGAVGSAAAADLHQALDGGVADAPTPVI